MTATEKLHVATRIASLDISRLENVKHLTDGAIRAACPACLAAGSDKSCDHLLIQANGKFGCAANPNDHDHRTEIFKLAGIRPSPKSASNITERKRIATIYDYRDADGQLLFQTVRYVPKDFKQRRPDPEKPDQWVWNLNGVERVLYRLPELKAAIAAGQTIYIAAGEKDVETLVKHGFAATCNPLGEKKDGSSWLPLHTEALRGARCVVVADKDETGRAHAGAVAAKIHGGAQFVRVIELPNLNGKSVKDSADFFAAGGTATRLQAIVDSAPEFEPAPVIPPSGGRNGHTPASWFTEKFPTLADEYGEPVLEETDKEGTISVRDIGEDFLAATLGEKGSPDAPTVFVPTEERLYTYAPGEGIFLQQRESVLLARLSKMLLACARDCKDGCETQTLEFRFRDSANLNGVLRKARGLLETPPNFFSMDLTEYIPCANGMLRLKDKMLLPFSPAYRRRNKLAVPFDSSAKCPLFLDNLMRAALNPDELDLLQRWCGLALIGENLAQKIVILTGIIGQTNLATLRPQLLGERFETSHFLGKTLLYGADVPENFLNQRGASVLKSLTGGDPVTLEFKNSNERPSIICKFNVIVTCNSRLTVHLEGDTDAWRRRLVIIPYQKPKPNQAIVDLAEQILRCEGSGVLNFAIGGLEKLRADKWQLHLTARQQSAVDNLLLESDGMTLFVREALAQIDDARLTVPDAFSAYVEYCNKHGWSAVTRKKFGDLIGDAVIRTYGLTVRHDVLDRSGKAQRGWWGLKLRVSFSRPTEKSPSGASEPSFLSGFPDGADGASPVHPAKNLLEEWA